MKECVRYVFHDLATSLSLENINKRNHDHSLVGCSIILADYRTSPVAVLAFSAIEALACLNFEASWGFPKSSRETEAYISQDAGC